MLVDIPFPTNPPSGLQLNPVKKQAVPRQKEHDHELSQILVRARATRFQNVLEERGVTCRALRSGHMRADMLDAP